MSADMDSANLITLVPECIPDPSRTQVGLVQVCLMDKAHKLSALIISENRDIGCLTGKG